MSASRAVELDLRLALDRFDLAVRLELDRGVTGLFGASGAGKSSLLETLAGLRRRARGRITFAGEPWLDTARRLFVPPERRGVGYVPQEGLLFPHWDVRRNLLAGAERARRAGRAPEAALAGVVELLELGPLLDRLPATLSGGERQRVALGRALVSGPRLLLLDEPLAALDLPLRRRLLPFLSRVCAELTIPVVLVSHDPVEIQALCDDVVVLSRGGVLSRGAPQAVLTDPAVFPLAERQGFENVLAGRLLRHESTGSVIGLGGGVGGEEGVELRSLRSGIPEGTEVLIALPASDILLASTEPTGLSARNILKAVVREVRPLGDRVLVFAELGAVTTVVVEVTEEVPAELGLEAGRPVFLAVKAASCRIYGRAGGAKEGLAG